MALCEQCGSVRIVVARPERIDQLLGLFSASRPFSCLRCGWRGRRTWSDEELRRLLDYGAGGAEPDPELAVLDRELPGDEVQKPSLIVTDFDLGAAKLEHIEAEPGIQLPLSQRAQQARGIVGKRITRQRRREMIVTVAVTSLVLVLLVVLSLTGSCGNSGYDAI